MQNIQSIDEQNKLELIKLITARGSKIAISLSEVIPLEQSNMVASSLIEINFQEGLEINVVKDFIKYEVKRTKNAPTLFRENNCSSILVTTVFKICGESYLKKIMSSIKKICTLKESIESDPLKIKPGGNIEKNLQQLTEFTKKILESIFLSVDKCPLIIRKICFILKKNLEKKFPEADSHHILSGFLFLRFFCTAVFDPTSYHIVNTSPTREGRRVLVLVSKILQVLANDSQFGELHDNHMVSINQFIEENKPKLRLFIDQLTTLTKEEYSFVDKSQDYYSKLHKHNISDGVNNLVPLLLKHYEKFEANLRLSDQTISDNENEEVNGLKKILNEIEFFEERPYESKSKQKNSTLNFLNTKLDEVSNRKKNSLKKHCSDLSQVNTVVNPLFRNHAGNNNNNNNNKSEKFANPVFGRSIPKQSFSLSTVNNNNNNNIHNSIHYLVSPRGNQLRKSGNPNQDYIVRREKSDGVVKGNANEINSHELKKSRSDEKLGEFGKAKKHSNNNINDQQDKISQLESRIEQLLREINLLSGVLEENIELKMKLREIATKELC